MFISQFYRCISTYTCCCVVAWFFSVCFLLRKTKQIYSGFLYVFFILRIRIWIKSKNQCFICDFFFCDYLNSYRLNHNLIVSVLFFGTFTRIGFFCRPQYILLQTNKIYKSNFTLMVSLCIFHKQIKVKFPPVNQHLSQRFCCCRHFICGKLEHL